MKIFITGGTGFLGRYLIHGLLEKGHEIITLTRGMNRFPELANVSSFKIIEGDLSTLRNLKLNIKFDICLHLAWSGVNRDEISDPVIQNNNIKWSEDVLNFSIDHGCSCFINFGSRQEYSPTPNEINENSECNPVSEYGMAKLRFYHSAKKICQLHAVKLIHLRLFSTYGIGDHPWSLINSTINNLFIGQNVKLGSCTHKWSFLHIDDFSQAILAITENLNHIGGAEIFNLASGEIRELKEFVSIIKENIPSEGKLLFGTFNQNAESAYSLIPNISKIQLITGWRERMNFNTGVKEIINYHRQSCH